MKRKLLSLLIIIFLCFSSWGCKPVEKEDFGACALPAILITDETGFDGDYAVPATWQAMAKYYIDHNLNVDCIENVQAYGEEDYEKTVSSAIFAEKDLIITASPVFKDIIEKLATDNFQQKFVTIGYIVDKPNVISVSFSQFDAGFLIGLAGALSGSAEQQNSFGFVDIQGSEEYKAYYDGYTRGIKEIIPNANIDVLMVKSTDDPMAAKMMAEELATKDYFVIFDPVLESVEFINNEVLNMAAAGHKMWLIGNDPSYYNFGMTDNSPSLVLTSIVNDYEVAIDTILDSIIDDSFIGGAVNTMNFSILNGGVSIDLFGGRNLNVGHIDTIKEYINKVKVGDISLE